MDPGSQHPCTRLAPEGKGGVEVAYAEEVPCIINRTRTGRCPLETLCDVSDNPVELYPVIEDFVRRMREAGEKEKTISEK